MGNNYKTAAEEFLEHSDLFITKEAFDFVEGIKTQLKEYTSDVKDNFSTLKKDPVSFLRKTYVNDNFVNLKKSREASIANSINNLSFSPTQSWANTKNTK